jgi:hypothetical protein
VRRMGVVREEPVRQTETRLRSILEPWETAASPDSGRCAFASHAGRALYRFVSVRSLSFAPHSASLATSRGYRTVPMPRASGS